jgi:hypothetical protein
MLSSLQVRDRPRRPQMRCRREIVMTTMFVLVTVVSLAAQQPYPFPPKPPTEVVQKFWDMASRGQLLTPEGWKEASQLFTVPCQPQSGKAIRIFSDFYGINASTVEGAKATVEMEYVDLGQIDEALRYTPPTSTPSGKTSFGYRLVSVQGYMLMHRMGVDGKTIIEKKDVPGMKVWQIEGHPFPPAPFLMVNAAIRYVVQAQRKTTDANIKANAEASLTKLLELQ